MFRLTKLTFNLVVAIALLSNIANAWHNDFCGGYGNGVYRPSFSYSCNYRPACYSSYASSWGLGGFGVRSYSSYYSSYSYPFAGCYSYRYPTYNVSFAPTYYYRSYTPYYYVPRCTYRVPVVVPTPVYYSSSFFYPTCSTTTPTSFSTSIPFAVTKSRATAPIQVQNPAGVPDQLLSAADSILLAGGYKEAARAYAQLASRYGNEEKLVTRRFVAQIASGDYHQAEVILALANANQQSLNMTELPGGSLARALGGEANQTRVTEALAENALQQTGDSLAMQTVSTWLTLGGDVKRAELFASHVKQLENQDLPTEPTTRLASTNLR